MYMAMQEVALMHRLKAFQLQFIIQFGSESEVRHGECAATERLERICALKS